MRAKVNSVYTRNSTPNLQEFQQIKFLKEYKQEAKEIMKKKAGTMSENL